MAVVLGLMAAGSTDAAPERKPHRAPTTKTSLTSKAVGPSQLGPTYGERTDVQAFARELAQNQLLDATWLKSQLAQARYQAAVVKLIMPPPAGTAKNWRAYRARFVESRRIQAGVAWWNEHQAWLELAETHWGVPAEMVAAIVGIETFYGRHTGSFKVIDALATLSFDFPSGRSDRSGFFRAELAAFLAWCAREGREPQSVKGSYAGAIGLPQFMPSSIARFAIDFDGDGHIQLDQSPADVIGSVAHYFAKHGWVVGQPSHFSIAAPVDATERARLLVPDILPTFSVAQLTTAGAELAPEALGFDGPLALVELQNGDQAPSYVAGTHNFWVVTRYNWSSYYAMAVIELAQALKVQRLATRPSVPPSAGMSGPTVTLAH